MTVNTVGEVHDLALTVLVISHFPLKQTYKPVDPDSIGIVRLETGPTS